MTPIQPVTSGLFTGHMYDATKFWQTTWSEQHIDSDPCCICFNPLATRNATVGVRHRTASGIDHWICYGCYDTYRNIVGVQSINRGLTRDVVPCPLCRADLRDKMLYLMLLGDRIGQAIRHELNLATHHIEGDFPVD